MLQLDAPALLTAAHGLSAFQSGESVLDEWLQLRALENIETGASRTYVICPKGRSEVVGFFSLSMGQILAQDVVGSMRRNMPRNIPAIILGRLAVDRNWQGQGIARALLAEVVSRSLRASSEVAARLIIVHAISEAAENFYLHHGFVKLPINPPTLAFDLMKYRRLTTGE